MPLKTKGNADGKKLARIPMGASDETKEALHKSDVEFFTRKSKTMQIEGDLPYDRVLYMNEVRFYLQRTAEGIIEAGKRLLVIKEKEGKGEFMALVEDEIGIPYRTATRFMHTALKAEKYPAITTQLAKLASCCNVYALLEAPEEDLQELETKGVLAGNTVDDLQRMSVKEMRNLINKLKTESDKIVKAEVKALETEKRALVKELDRLKAFDPENTDISWSIAQMEAISKLHNEFDTALRLFAFDKRILAHPELQAKVEGIHREVEVRFKDFVENWDAFVDGPEGGE
ncbi:hypothetical protein EPN18_04490 [bacterium]|nr:MAG: hypothetical protein EPN18_04490 [bacterium]